VKRVFTLGASAALFGGALLGCENHAPRVAPGFKRDSVARLRVGLPVEDLSHTLGPPLAKYSEDGEATDVNYIYAIQGEWTTSGGGWHLLSGKGPACMVTVSGGVIAEVFVSTGHTLCTCTRQSCPDTWLASCASGVPK
jgi:hypothetical protein